MDIDQANNQSSSSDDEDGVTQNPEKNFVDTNYRLKFESSNSSDADQTLVDTNINDEIKVEQSPKTNGKNAPIANGNGVEQFRKQKRSRSRSMDRKDNSAPHKRNRMANADSDEEDEKSTQNLASVQIKNAKEDAFWQSRRVDREKISGRGTRQVWGHSPTHADLEEVFSLHEAAERKAALELKGIMGGKRDNISSSKPKRKRSVSSASGTSSSERKHKKKHKKHSSSKHKKEHKKKHHKKDRKRSHRSDSKESNHIKEEWVELTKELREEEAQKTKEEEAQVIGPQIPEHLMHTANPSIFEGKMSAQERKDMLRGEAAAMAAYVAQGKRIPRRGEIGLSSNEITEFEKVGYVMSGTRHKSMEATRLRKENQILTAEEKRLLNSFSLEERKNREETVLKQFQELISSKKSKN